MPNVNALLYNAIGSNPYQFACAISPFGQERKRMKFRNFGQASLAILATLAATLGVSACKQNYSTGYFYVTGVKTGTTTGEIGAFKVNSTNGALFTVPGQPFSSGGSNPIRVAVDLTGRYIFVLNQGVESTDPSTGNLSYTGNGIGVFSVGGDGSIAFQQGYSPTGVDDLRIAEYSGSYLYVLDKYAPAVLPGTQTIANASPSYSSAFPCYDSKDNVYRPVGSITAYQVSSNDGILTLIQNQQQHGITYFPVGCFPVDMHIAGDVIYTMDAGSSTNNDVETVFPYQIGASNGQLTTTTNGPQAIPGAVDINTIDGDTTGNYLYLLDAGNNEIYSYTPGNNGSLVAVQGSPFSNISGVAQPDALVVSGGSSEKFLYVANAAASSSLSSSNSGVSYFTIDQSAKTLTPDPPSFIGTGSGPITVLIDPTNQFLYTVDHVSGTITGRLFNPNTGTLTDLNVNSTYHTVDFPTWGVIDSHTD
jgi:6-phosphogluconolactonase (cycloisomerase 2 family)